MKSKDTLGKRVGRSMGTIMMVTWMLILGPIGAVLLGAVAYSMLAKNPIQGVLCGILLFLPLFLTIAWGIERWLHARRETEPPKSSPSFGNRADWLSKSFD